MKSFGFVAVLLILLAMISTSTMALDPQAPPSFRKFGMIYVDVPNPSIDKVMLTNLKSGQSELIKAEKVKVVPIGKYRVDVAMDGYKYRQNVRITPTERTDVVVAGFGNLKVKGPRKAEVEVYERNGRLLTAFPANKTKTLPRGSYDVRVKVGDSSTLKPDVRVVTQATRILDVET